MSNQETTETRHYFRVPFEISEEVKFKNMKPTSQILYYVFCRLANNYSDSHGWFYRSINKLVEDTGLDRKTIINAKKELIKNNFIDESITQYENKRGRACNAYKINGFRFRVKG